MKEFLGKINEEKINFLIDIKLKIINKEIEFDDAKHLLEIKFDTVTPEEFAFAEQKLKSMGIEDDIVKENMNDLCDLVVDVLVKDKNSLPNGHPIQTYRKETALIKIVLNDMEELLNKKFIKNQWLELYEKLVQFKVHLSRKQNQLFSILEEKGFDRPSKIMWTFDNIVRDSISEGMKLLQEDKIDEFLSKQENVIHVTRDIIQKEEDILFPTSLKLVNEDEFRNMRSGDDEIGYCIIETPKGFLPKAKDLEEKIQDNTLTQDLKELLKKHGIVAEEEKVFDVAQGKLTLEQINLIYKHSPVDFSFVDENEIVKFYSDTKHRVFPRSKGVIGRNVNNCHPRESLETVQSIIKAFRAGLKDKADFWLDMKGTFIYITYIAIRDDEGNFKGVLEMMQDVTKIRSLKGSQTLLSWDA